MNINDLTKWISNNGDKILHDYAGELIAGFSTILLVLLTISPYLSIGVGFIVATIVGYLKEWLYDKKMGKGTYDMDDFKAVVVGALRMSIILALYTAFI